MERYVSNYYPTVDQMAIDGGVVGVNDVPMDRWTPFVLRSDYDAQLADAQATIAALQAMNNRLGGRVETLEAQLAQRTAELAAAKKVKADYDRWLSGGVYFTTAEYMAHIDEHRAELERVRGELATYKEARQ